MIWATRTGVHIDRAACAWLIRRFIDPEARFVFVDDPADVPAEATPFDIRGVELSHHGQDCTFETILKRYDLADRVLWDIARIVHEADLDDERYDAPEAPGLDVLLRGLSMVRGDEEVLAISGPLFDGLYESEAGRRCSDGSPRDRKEDAMKWVTRENANVDRIACPWLIKQFIDPEAEVPVRSARSGARGRRTGSRTLLRRTGRRIHTSRREVLVRRPGRGVHAHGRSGPCATRRDSARRRRLGGPRHLTRGPRPVRDRPRVRPAPRDRRPPEDRLETPMYDALYAWCGQQTP